MQKTKLNGHAGPAVPAPALPPVVITEMPPPPPLMPQDPFDQLKVLVQKIGDQRYAAGFRRASEVIARSVGQLDGEAKTKLMKVMDQLELELHQAETATR